MFGKLFNNMRASRARAKAVHELRHMDPRLLRDLGIAPDQIDDYVAGRLNR